MAITRTSVMQYVSGRYAALITALGLAASDAPTTFGPAIDQVFLALGVAAADLASASAADSTYVKAYALADYYTLQYLAAAAAAKVDVSSDGAVQQGQRSQLFRHIKDLLKEAAQRVEELGYENTGGQVGVDVLVYGHDPYLYLPDEYRVLP